ncbi:hypothetical protein [Pantoea dispersa]
MRTSVFNYMECDCNRLRRKNVCCGLSSKSFENRPSLRTVSIECW